MADERQGNIPEPNEAPIPPEGERPTAPVQEERRRPLTFDDGALRKDYKERKKGGMFGKIAVLLVLVVVAAVVVMFAQRWTPPKETLEDKRVSILELDKANIAEVTVHVTGDEPYTVEAVPDVTPATYRVRDWPESVRINQYRISDAYALSLFTAEEIVDEAPQSLTEYALDTPASTVTISMQDGTEYVLLLGGKVPTVTGYYAMLQGDERVFRIGDYAGARMLHTTKDIRELEIFEAITVDSANYILIEQRGGASLEMRMEPSDVSLNSWKILQPEPLEADIDAVTALAEKIIAVELGAYVDTPEDYAQYGLDEPTASVMITDDTGATMHFHVGNLADESGENTYVRLEGQNEVYTVSTASLDFIKTTTLTTVADRFAAIVNIANVDRMEVQVNGDAYDVQFTRTEQYGDNGELMLLTDGTPNYLQSFAVNGQKVDDYVFKKVYQAIIALTVQGEVQGEVSGDPAAQITFHMNNGSPSLTTQYIPYQQDYYAMRQNEGSILFYTRKNLVDNVADYMNSMLALPYTGDAAHVTGIEIDRGEGDVRTFTRDGGNATYQGVSIDGSAVEKAFTQLLGVTIQAWIVDRTGGEQPVMTVTYTYDDGRAPTVVEYRAVREGYYGMSVVGQTGRFLVATTSFQNELNTFDGWIAE
jgi:hypothetical protein